MKKTIKMAVVVGLACCVLGTLMCLAGLIGGANPGVVFNSDALDIEYDDGILEVEEDFMADIYREKDRKVVSNEEFRNIVIETEVSEVTVRGDQEFRITVEDAYYDFVDEAVQYELKDGTLYVTEKQGADRFGIHEELREIEICIPKEIPLETVEIKQGIGDLTVSLLTIKDLNISTETAEVDLEALKLENLNVSNNVGEIDCSVDVSKKAVITNVSGDTELRGDYRGEIYLNNGSGEMEVGYTGAREDYYVYYETNEGSIATSVYGQGYYYGSGYKIAEIVNDPDAPNRIIVNNGTGSIHFDR